MFSSAVLLPSQQLPSAGTQQGKAAATPPLQVHHWPSFALPSTGATLTPEPRTIPVWSSKQRPNCHFPREQRQRNPSLPLGQLTWPPWITKTISPLVTLCPLRCRPGLIFFSHNEWADYANKLKPLLLRMRLQVYQLPHKMATLSISF